MRSGLRNASRHAVNRSLATPAAIQRQYGGEAGDLEQFGRRLRKQHAVEGGIGKAGACDEVLWVVELVEDDRWKQRTEVEGIDVEEEP